MIVDILSNFPKTKYTVKRPLRKCDRTFASSIFLSASYTLYTVYYTVYTVRLKILKTQKFCHNYVTDTSLHTLFQEYSREYLQSTFLHQFCYKMTVIVPFTLEVQLQIDCYLLQTSNIEVIGKNVLGSKSAILNNLLKVQLIHQYSDPLRVLATKFRDITGKVSSRNT